MGREKSYSDALYVRVPSWVAPKHGDMWTVEVELRSATIRTILVEDIQLELIQGIETHLLHHAGEDMQGSNGLIPRASDALPKKIALQPNTPTITGVLRFLDTFPFQGGEVQVQLSFIGRQGKDVKQVILGNSQVSNA